MTQEISRNDSNWNGEILNAREIKARHDSGFDARRLMLQSGEEDVAICGKVSATSRVNTAKPKNHQIIYRRSLQNLQQQRKQEQADFESRSEIARTTRDRIKPKIVRNAISKVFGEGFSNELNLTLEGEIPDENSPIVGNRGDASIMSHVTGGTCSTRNFVKENRSIASRSSSLCKSKSDKPLAKNEDIRHSSFGKVPSYLQNRKSQWARQERKAEEQLEMERLGVPEGQVLMKEEQRLAILKELNFKLDEMHVQLQRLPIACRTISTEAKREKLEKIIYETENNIERFSQKNIYVLEHVDEMLVD